MVKKTQDPCVVILCHLIPSSAGGGATACGSGVLVTATNQADKVELRIHQSTSGPEDSTSYTAREFNGYSLSPECGELFEKCKTLLVVGINNSGNNNTTDLGSSGQLQKSIVAIPLSNALGLLALDFSSGLKAEVHVVLPDPSLDCSPQEVHIIQNSYFTLCANFETGFVSLLELKLNATHFQKSYLSHSEDISQGPLYNLTNSVYVELPSKSGNHIYFAAGYSIYYYKPLDYIFEEFDVSLATYGCFATELEYVGGWDMIVYCNNSQALYIDLDRESIKDIRVDYAKDGRPYVCPNPDVYLGVNSVAEYIEYGFFSTQNATDFEVSMGIYDNGVCFGSEETSLFAFADREMGTRILRASASGGFITSLSDSTCINYPCLPLVVLEDRYLVLREKRQGDWHISIFDSHDNFSLVRNVPHIKADLLAVVDKCVSVTKTSSSVATPTVSPVPRSKSRKYYPVVIGISVAVCLLLLVLSVGAAIFAIVMMRRQKKGQNIAVEQFGHNGSSLVLGTASTAVEGNVYVYQPVLDASVF